MENVQIKIGIIGLGRMGRFYLDEMRKSGDEMRKSGKWDIAYICDVNPLVRKEALQWGLDAQIVSDEQVIFEDPSVQAVGLFTLADQRLRQIEKAVRYGKHILAEKPIADSIEREWKAVELILEKSENWLLSVFVT